MNHLSFSGKKTSVMLINANEFDLSDSEHQRTELCSRSARVTQTTNISLWVTGKTLYFSGRSKTQVTGHCFTNTGTT